MNREAHYSALRAIHEDVLNRVRRLRRRAIAHGAFDTAAVLEDDICDLKGNIAYDRFFADYSRYTALYFI